MLSDIKTVLIALFFGVLGSVVFLSINNYVNKKQIVTVDLNSILSAHVESFGMQDLNDKEREFITAQFSGRLKEILTRISDEENLIVIVKPAVVSNVPDYTDIISRKLDSYIE